MIADALFGGAAALLLVGAWADLARRIIPDGISCGVLLAGVGLRLVEGAAAAVWLWAAGAALLTFMALALVWRWGLIGGGDVKLLAASVLLVPPASVPALLLSTSLAGGVLALIYLAAGAVARRRGPRPAGGPPRTVL
ncbi:prepilin peptidase, partial [Acidisphaera rubrifaciens]|uniref:prepilin peptidase n=1 Tax=Acidisphaera rubrifaciens TaxID=50715 RepID=UPI000661FF62